MTEHLTEVTTLVVALKTATLVLGGLVTYFALLALTLAGYWLSA